MRTTLDLTSDALDAIRTQARERNLSLGAAASELVRRGIRYRLPTRRKNGVPVFEVPDDFPVVTSAQVRELLDEE